MSDCEFTKNEEETRKENIERLERAINRGKSLRKPNTYEQYYIDICNYLHDKFPDKSVSEIQEAAAFISNRTSVVVSDMREELNREWRRAFDRVVRRKEKTTGR